MKTFGLLRKIFTVVLVAAFVLITPLANHSSALAASNSQPVLGGLFGGSESSSVDAYRKLQKGTYNYRNQGYEGEGSQTGRIGNRLELTQRTGGKLQNRMDNRQDLTSNKNSARDAAKNLTDNTQNAFQNAGEKVRGKLNFD